MVNQGTPHPGPLPRAEREGKGPRAGGSHVVPVAVPPHAKKRAARLRRDRQSSNSRRSSWAASQSGKTLPQSLQVATLPSGAIRLSWVQMPRLRKRAMWRAAASSSSVSISASFMVSNGCLIRRDCRLLPPVTREASSIGAQSSSGSIRVMAGCGSSISTGPHSAMSLCSFGERLSLRQ